MNEEDSKYNHRDALIHAGTLALAVGNVLGSKIENLDAYIVELRRAYRNYNQYILDWANEKTIKKER